MSSVETAVDALDALQARFQDVLDGIEGVDVERDTSHQQTYQWLQRQITSRIAQMKGLRLDLELGLSPLHLGYASMDELLETIQDIESELLGLERAARELEGMMRGK